MSFFIKEKDMFKPYKNLNDPDNHDTVITHLEPDILECEVKWALGSITMNKASGDDRIPVAAAAAAKSLQSCPTLCDPMDCSLPVSSIHGIFQARVLEWVAIAFSGIPAELFQILKDDTVKMLYSICQQIWKTQQWPQDWKRPVLFQSQRKAMPKNAQTPA